MFEHKTTIPVALYTWTTRKLSQVRSFQRNEIEKQAYK